MDGAATAETESHKNDAKITAESDDDVGRPETNVSGNAKASAPSGIVVREKPDVTAEQMRWTENFYRHPEASVKADRYRFLQIDWGVFYDELEKTQAYLAASSGRTPPPVYDDTPPTFRFAAFEDRPLDLLVTEVQFDGDLGSRHIVIYGHIAGSDDGTFRLSTTEGEQNLTGRIETPDYLIRVDTFNRAPFTTVAEFDQAVIEKAKIPVDFSID
jgi:hypothetical protein